MIYTIAAILFLILLIILVSVAKLNLKISLIVSVSIFIFLSLITFAFKPSPRKPFNLNVIEKILKINSDGSTTIIQTTTTRELKQK